MHNTSHADDEPYPTLLQEKGFRGFPSLAFMDAEGNVLSPQEQWSVAGFTKTLGLLENYLALKAKAEGGDKMVANELFMVELDLNKLDYDTATARYAELKDLSDAQTSRIEEQLLRLEMQGLLATAQNLENAGKWAEASAVYKTITEKNPADAMAWIDLGNTLASQGKLEEALVAYMKAVEMPGTSTAIIRIGMYNAACAYALLGDKDKAFKWLKKAAEAGYKNAAQVERDTDLDSLRDDPRYKEIIALMKG